MKSLKSHIKAYEFIGNTTEIVKAKNKSQIGIKGKIIDETQNMFIIEPNKCILKKDATFKMALGPKYVAVDGKQLIGRPSDRIKKVLK